MASSPGEAGQSSSSQPGGGALKWIWRGFLGVLFSRRNLDFEKRLQHLSKEEVAVHSRLKRRTHTWRKVARGIVMYALIIESLALGVALFSARLHDMPWNTRALRVLPVFGVPALASMMYSICARYYHMMERKDQRTLERLRAERQARIDELKQKTNYYATQELIQRYDLDPTAKAAAASVLAAKLGAESGMNVAFKASDAGESSTAAATSGRVRSPAAAAGSEAGLRNRKSSQQQQLPGIQQQGRSDSFEQQGFLQALEAEVNGEKEREALERDAAMDRARGRVGVGAGGGWLARVAAMLVGEDPSQCYALICKACRMHNGLAPKEEFQYITYICPHCHTLNGSGQLLMSNDDINRGAAASAPELQTPTPAPAPAAAAAPAISSSKFLEHQTLRAEQQEADDASEETSSLFTTHTAESGIAES